MKKVIKLNESDLNYMIRKTINEILSMEGGDIENEGGKKFYFGSGWKKGYEKSNPFTAEGPVGENFDEFASQAQEYFTKLREKYEKSKDSFLLRDFKIIVEMPCERNTVGPFERGWRDYAQVAPPKKTVKVDPENFEEGIREAWDIFNEYASRTPEVIGWWAWQWSSFPPTLKPILTPKVGKLISGEEDNIRSFYSSYKPGDYVGD